MKTALAKTLLVLLLAFPVASAGQRTLSGPASAQRSPARVPSAFAPDRLARVDQLLQRYVDENSDSRPSIATVRMA